MPAEPIPRGGDIDVLSPPDLAAEPVAVPESSSVEPAVEPSLDPEMPSDPAPMEHEILAPPPFDHNLIHFPKLSTCDVCNRARLCSKRVKSRRVANEELNLSEPDACGQQLACDHLIDFKSLRSNEHAVLISQMCCKLIQQFERSIPTRIQSQALSGPEITLLYHCSIRCCRRNLESCY